MKCHRILEEQYSKEISDVHMNMIARSCCENWRSLYSYLELEKIVVNDVIREYSHEESRRDAFLKKWREKKGCGATYLKLVYALLKIGCKEDAEGVCKIVAGSSLTESPASSGSPAASPTGTHYSKE